MARHHEVRLQAGEIDLAGTFTLPDGPPPEGRRGRYPNALLLGSWLPRDRSGGWDRARHASWFAADGASARAGLLDRVADALAVRGVASLRYDPRGCGVSDGSWEASDLFTATDDARDALAHLRARPEADVARTALVGHGEGAGVAMSVAIGDPAVGALLLAGASARSFRDVLRRGVAARWSEGIDHQHSAVAALDRSAEELIERADRHEPVHVLSLGDERVELGLARWRQAFGTPPMALATMLNRRVILVHGRRDAWSSPDESVLLRAVLRRDGEGPALELVDAGHDLAELTAAALDRIAGEVAAALAEPRRLPPVLLAIQDGDA